MSSENIEQHTPRKLYGFESNGKHHIENKDSFTYDVITWGEGRRDPQMLTPVQIRGEMGTQKIKNHSIYKILRS